MPNSNKTKQLLANALKELLQTESFEKVNVSKICEKADMNRKTFYYHFMDKYDLVNWIFDTEIVELISAPDLISYENRLKFLEILCDYFYKNRIFYRKVLEVKGQNSFSEYYEDFMYKIIKHRYISANIDYVINDFYLDIIAGGTVWALNRWITTKNAPTPDVIIPELTELLELTIERKYKELHHVSK